VSGQLSVDRHIKTIKIAEGKGIFRSIFRCFVGSLELRANHILWGSPDVPLHLARCVFIWVKEAAAVAGIRVILGAPGSFESSRLSSKVFWA
jgi:hypothetical protein